MRHLSLILLFSVLVCGQNHSQSKSSHQPSDAGQGHYVDNSTVTDATQVSTRNKESTPYEKHDNAQAEPVPWLSHGEWVMSILTAAYVGLTAIYVVVSLKTVRYIATSNEISRKNMESVQRAFVFLKQTDLTGINDPLTNQMSGVGVRVTWENSGTTPTKRAYIYTGVLIRDLEVQRGEPFPDVGEIDKVPSVLGPKGIFWTPDIVIPATHFMKGRHVYVYGMAVHKDVFENTPEHITKFFMKLSINAPNTASSRPILTAHFEHNEGS
jgi:hypothetical protein